MKLDGKVAIVTGAGRGIGKATALLLAREGAKVVVADVDSTTMQQTVKEITDAGGEALAVKANVASRAEIENMVKTAVNTFGTVHILVNNAAITRGGKLVKMSEQDWDDVINVDLKSVFLTIQVTAPYMINQHYGKIVNIASVGAFAGLENLGCYGAAKAGVVQLTRAAARELGRQGINVNAIAPGTIDTEQVHSSWSEERAQAFIAQRSDVSSLGRVGQPEDVAKAVLFLVSDDASFITGQLLCVEGGRTDYMGP